MARDVRAELEKFHRWFVRVAQLTHALFITEPSIMKENTQTAQTLPACSATFSTGEGRGCVRPRCIFWNWEYSTSFQIFITTLTLGTPMWIPMEAVTQTNQYAVIICPHPCLMSRSAAAGSFRAFPLQWRATALAEGRWRSEMDHWFPVYQNAYGLYNGHYFPLAWRELLFSNACLSGNCPNPS